MADVPKQQPVQQTYDLSHISPAVMEAPVVIVDGVQGLAAGGQIVKFNLFQDRMISDPGSVEFERVVCLRLVMSQDVFIQLANWMKSTADGLIPVISTSNVS